MKNVSSTMQINKYRNPSTPFLLVQFSVPLQRVRMQTWQMRHAGERINTVKILIFVASDKKVHTSPCPQNISHRDQVLCRLFFFRFFLVFFLTAASRSSLPPPNRSSMSVDASYSAWVILPFFNFLNRA